MALTFAKQAATPPLPKSGGLVLSLYRITLDGSYLAGGWAVEAADFNLTAIIALIIPNVTPGGYALSWDRANGKIKAFEEADGGTALQEIDGTELDTVVLDVLVVGY